MEELCGGRTRFHPSHKITRTHKLSYISILIISKCSKHCEQLCRAFSLHSTTQTFDCGSWCNTEILDSEIHIVGYNIYRCDHETNHGGGVLLYVHNDLQSTMCEMMSDI